MQFINQTTFIACNLTIKSQAETIQNDKNKNIFIQEEIEINI
jgi:hypothetical protein